MPLMVVVNGTAGRQRESPTVDQLRSHLNHARQPHEIHAVKRPRDLPQAVQRAADAAQARGGALVAVGGDGGINTVAAEAWRRGLALGVVPQGTFNYFGRTHAVPEDLEAAVRHLLDGVRHGRLRPVQLGLLNQEVFLVNASVGLYPQLLQDREAYKRRLGRSRWVAAWAALRTLMSPHRDLHLQLCHEGEPQRVVRTPTLFVGNNPLQMAQVGLPEASLVGRGTLSAVALAPVSRWGLLKLALLGGLGRLGDAQAVQHGAVTSLTVAPVGGSARRVARPVRVAMDGEARWCTPPLTFEVAAQPLWLLGADMRPRAD